MVESKLLFICGSGHSGSTLLDMLLGGHPEISALGEVHRLSIGAVRDDGPYRCTCGKAISKCEFWEKVRTQLQSIVGYKNAAIYEEMITTDPDFVKMRSSDGLYLGPSTKRVFYQLHLKGITMAVGSDMLWRIFATLNRRLAMHRHIIENSLKIYEAVRKAWNTPIVVDSTKNAGRMKGLFILDKESFNCLYLLRDGRAVTCSRMRRENRSMDYCAKVWVSEHQKLQLALWNVPKNKVLHVKYEDLCRNPRKELSKICSKLGTEYWPDMLDFRTTRHNIGGNPMRFRSGEDTIALDERWKSELSPQDLNVFERIGGKLNRSFGYLPA